jgi:hypothetical protein
MLLTGLQHRKLAKLLRQKAAKLPHKQKIRVHQAASLHMALARAQENNPSLAPAAKNLDNHNPPDRQPNRPVLLA